MSAHSSGICVLKNEMCSLVPVDRINAITSPRSAKAEESAACEPRAATGQSLDDEILKEFQKLNYQEKMDFLSLAFSWFGAGQEEISFDQPLELKQNP